jgi:iron complex transport system substrate-binding protein
MPAQSVSYRRIVSLTPSLTEILFALGLGEAVAGVTDACDYPGEALRKPHVHSWFDPDMDKIRDVGPDLILGLESAHAHLRKIFEEKREGVPFILTHPGSVDQALEDIAFLGNLLGVPDRARRLLRALQERLVWVDDRVRRIAPDRRPTVSRVLEWTEDQLIVAGPLSFQYDVITRAGGRNVTGTLPDAYPKISLSQFQAWDPEVVFFCGVNARFISRLREHPRWMSFRCVREGRVHGFDCGLTCRTGPRIVDMVALLHRTLYGEEPGGI